MNTGIFYREPRARAETNPISPEDLIANTELVDISDDYLWMERAHSLTAEAYLPLADPKFGLRIEDVLGIVSTDFYEQQGRARTIAALTLYPDTGGKLISGLVRIVSGEARRSRDDPDPIDAMNFIEPALGWPHAARGISEDEIAELGRFMIVANCRTPTMRDAGVHAHLTRRLYDAAVEIMRKQGGRLLYAIMPPYMVRLIKKAQIQIVEIESRLKTDDPFAASVFDKFSLYWRHASPKLYEWPDAPLAAEHTPAFDKTPVAMNPS